MKLLSVDIAKYPQHEAALRASAVRVIHDGKTVQVTPETWQRIQRATRPKPSEQEEGLAIEARLDAEGYDPKRDPSPGGCGCDPPNAVH